VTIGRTDTFRTRRERVLALFEEGRYGDALAQARGLRKQFPTRGEIPFWMACALCRLGRADDALATLRAGLDDGIWWPSGWLRDDDDLAALRGSAGLEAVVAASERLHAAHAAESRCGEALMLAPEAPLMTHVARGADGAGILLALHGWGEQATDFVSPWRAATRTGLLVVAPESSQELSPGFFVWDDRERARDDVARALSRVRTRRSLDERRSLYAGFSQGGGLAVSWALGAGPLRSTTFLALGTGFGDVAAEALESLDEAAARGARGGLIVGDADDSLDGARALHESLVRGGVACDLEVVPGLGHDLPHDLGERLLRAIGFLLPPPAPPGRAAAPRS
jgi:predicted esterase